MEDLTPVVLAVGTTHPWNIAGIGLDARVGPLLGVRIVTVVAGISAQSATRVLAREAVSASAIGAQFEALQAVPIAAIHVGALLDVASVHAVRRGIVGFRVPTVCDPVIAATGGGRLADDATICALRDVLFPCCRLITPNMDEAGLLLGSRVENLSQMEAAGRALLETNSDAVLVKGGHLSANSTDVLVEACGVEYFGGPRLPGALRGTGDLLACAIAAGLARGVELLPSITAARTFVRRHLVEAVDFAGTPTLSSC